MATNKLNLTSVTPEEQLQASSSAQTPPVSVSVPGTSATQIQIESKDQANQRIREMFKEQSLKNNWGNTLRFRMSIPGTGYTFQANLDPNDVTHQKQKRLVQLDVLTGIVIQDFGYKPEVLEIKGTTGSAYYQAIKSMDDIFSNQNKTKPMTVSLYLEGVNYTGVWTRFQYNRTINAQAGNLVQYSMEFIVFTNTGLDSSTADIIANGAPVVMQNTANGTSSNANTTVDVSYSGSISDYVNKTPGLIINKGIVLNFIQSNWNTNLYGPLPNVDTILKSNQKITIPVSWSNYFTQAK